MNSDSDEISFEEMITNSIYEELEKINNLVEINKKNGYKIPLLACVLLLFYKTKKLTLKRSEINELILKEISNNENNIISSVNDKYPITTSKNLKSKLFFILNKKTLFLIKKVRSEEEYTLKPGSATLAFNNISKLFDSIHSNEFFSITKEIKENKNDFTIELHDYKSNKKGKNNDKIKAKKEELEKPVNKIKKDMIKKKKIKESYKNIDYDIIIKDDDDTSVNGSEENFINNQNIKYETIKSESYNIVPQFLNKKREIFENKPKKTKKTSKAKENNKSSAIMKNSMEILENKLSNSVLNKIQPNEENQLKIDELYKEKKDINNIDIDAVISLGEKMLKYLKRKEFSMEISDLINSLKENISQKEKEIKSDKQLIKKIIQKDKTIKSSLIPFEEKLSEVKVNFKEFKEIKNYYDSKKNSNAYKSDNFEKIVQKMSHDTIVLFNSFANIKSFLSIINVDEKLINDRMMIKPTIVNLNMKNLDNVSSNNSKEKKNIANLNEENKKVNSINTLDYGVINNNKVA